MKLNESFRGELRPGYRRQYILGGRAVVTLSQKDLDGEKHRTYFIRETPDSKERGSFGNVSSLAGGTWIETLKFFVKVLVVDSYMYIGMLELKNGDLIFRITAKSYRDVKAINGFKWLLKHLEQDFVEKVRLYHEGICSRCGRGLTNPDSIERGIGPICIGLM